MCKMNIRNAVSGIMTDKSDREDLERVIDLLPLREQAMERAIQGLKNVHPSLDDNQLFALAATDIFVEKAQHVLTRRSSTLRNSGFAAIGATVVILCCAVYSG